METYALQLRVRDPIDDAAANRLVESGVDDGHPESGPVDPFIGFDWEAESFADAVLGAGGEVEAAGMVVLRLDPEDLVSAADIAARTGRRHQSVPALIAGERGRGGWPTPVAGNVRSPLWRWAEVAESIEAHA